MLLSHQLWQRRFASDPAIVGTALILNDEPHTIVGVLPASFDFASVFAPGSHFDLYFPFPLSQETNRYGNTMAMIGRLKPDVSALQAQGEIRTLYSACSCRLPAPARWRDWMPSASPFFVMFGPMQPHWHSRWPLPS